MDARIEASYRICRRVARRAASNFYFSFFMLPPQQRSAMFALYAFLRQTDDLTDAEESLEIRRTRLAQWRNRLEAALDGASEEATLPALVDAVRRFNIPSRHLFDVIDGCEMDLTRTRYKTFAELETYCEHVAAAVGLACIHVWGFDGEDAYEPARACGVAFQLTEFLVNRRTRDALSGPPGRLLLRSHRLVFVDQRSRDSVNIDRLDQTLEMIERSDALLLCA